MEIKGRKRWVWGAVLVLSLIVGGVAAVQAAGGERPSESEDEARVPFMQRLLRLSIPMPRVKEREETEQRVKELQERESQWLAEHTLRVERETIQESIAILCSEGVDIPRKEGFLFLSSEAFRLSINLGNDVESVIYEFVHDSHRMRHIIRSLARVKTDQFEEAKSLIAHCVGDFVDEAWSLRGEDYVWFNSHNMAVLPFLIFYFFEPAEGLVLLNKLFDATVYANTINYKYGGLGDYLREQGIMITTDERNNDVIKVVGCELHLIVYVMCAYIERMSTDPKYMEHASIVPILDDILWLRDVALTLNNEQRKEQAMPEDQYLMLTPNYEIPSGFEIQYVRGYREVIAWFRMYKTDELDYLYFMREKLRELVVAFGSNGAREGD